MITTRDKVYQDFPCHLKGKIRFRITFDDFYVIEDSTEIHDIRILMLKGEKGSTNYNELSNKPSINGIILENGLTLDDLDIQEKMRRITEEEIDIMMS